MKQILCCMSALAFFLLLAGATQAQDNVKQTRTISGIRRLRVSMGIEAFVRLGDTESLHIEARNIPEEKILIEQNGDELVLKLGLETAFKKSPANRSVKAYLTLRELRAVAVTAGASVVGETPFLAGKFDLSSVAGATAKLDVRAEDIAVTCNSGASIDLRGTARSMTVAAGSGASVSAGDLVADVVNAKANSGASVLVNARKEFTGKAWAGGSVTNRGPGRAVSTSQSLGGSTD